MKRRAAVNIYATRADLEPGVRVAESARRLQYVLCGLFDSPALTVYGSLLDVETLGRCPSPDHIAGPRYLVLDAVRHVEVRDVPQRSGGTKYALDQLENPGSITVLPGGLFDEECLLAGQIGTAADDNEAAALYREYSRAVTNGFRKLKGYLVGPEALALLDRGIRLTTAVRAPREYDLKR